MKITKEQFIEDLKRFNDILANNGYGSVSCFTGIISGMNMEITYVEMEEDDPEDITCVGTEETNNYLHCSISKMQEYEIEDEGAGLRLIMSGIEDGMKFSVEFYVV